jgi:hypothetical protein
MREAHEEFSIPNERDLRKNVTTSHSRKEFFDVITLKFVVQVFNEERSSGSRWTHVPGIALFVVNTNAPHSKSIIDP